MASGYKNPPKFDEDDYEAWKNELDIWILVTELDKEKQALAVTLSLRGKAKEAALSIKAENLNAENGIETLLTKLDGIYLKDTIDSAYESYTKFDSFKRLDEMSISEFIIEFDQRYENSKKFKMELPDAVLAFKLLDGANLTIQERQLALTACHELKYSTMKTALKRIFGEGSRLREENDSFGVKIKQENAYYNQNRFSRSPRKRMQWSKFDSGNNTDTHKSGQPTNPLNRFGNPSKCKICMSILHWWKDCPHRYDNMNRTHTHDDESRSLPDNVEQCNITLFTETVESVFTVETQNAAVIDTACTKTVCGEKWLKRFEEDIDCGIQRIYSRKPFRFGDGKIVHSFSKVKVPAKIGSIKCHIETEVVHADIPLLLSKASLKKAGAKLDLKNDSAIMFEQPVELQFTSNGHYCIDLIDRNAPGKFHQNDNTQEALVTVNDGLTDTKKYKTECSERTQRAIHTQTRPTPEYFEIGDKVHYETPNSHEWKGPAIVTGQEGPLVFVRHRGTLVRVHECRLTKTHCTEDNIPMKSNNGMNMKPDKMVTEDVVMEKAEFEGIRSWNENDVFIDRKDIGQHMISTRWILKELSKRLTT